MVKKDDYNTIMEFLGDNVKIDFLRGRKTKSGQEHHIHGRVIHYLNIIQVVEGRFFYRINGQNREYLSNGKVLLIPSQVKHSIGMDKCSGIIRWADIKITFLNMLNIDQLFDYPNVLEEMEGMIIGDAIECISEIRERGSSNGIRDVIAYKKHCFDILNVIMNHAKPKENVQFLMLNLKRLHPVFKYIDDHLTQRISREVLAEILNISVNRCHTIFKEALNTSPMEYIRKKRLEKAQILLTETEKTISEVADQLLFYDAFHFSKSFKQTFGLSPSDYRNKVRIFLSIQ